MLVVFFVFFFLSSLFVSASSSWIVIFYFVAWSIVTVSFLAVISVGCYSLISWSSSYVPSSYLPRYRGLRLAVLIIAIFIPRLVVWPLSFYTSSSSNVTSPLISPSTLGDLYLAVFSSVIVSIGAPRRVCRTWFPTAVLLNKVRSNALNCLDTDDLVSPFLL